jgi:hypothetical protein
VKLFVHKARIDYHDFGHFLSSRHGLKWSADGDPQKAFGFEDGDFEALYASKREHVEAAQGRNVSIEIARGPDVVRVCDMNPHGLV